MDKPKLKFVAEIEKFLRKHKVSPTEFGRLAVADLAFVTQVRAGRNPRIDTVEAVRAWMRAYERGEDPLPPPYRKSRKPVIPSDSLGQSA